MAAGGNGAGSGRFVGTKAIRDAIKGRGTDILDALNVAWRRGTPHIGCPYPTHDDHDPSWRWDTKSQRAFCTCIEKSHNVLDVVAHMLGLDFEAAKIRTAELLHRQDLIREKGAGAGASRSDPQSLLNPAAGDRDDGLVYIYLASRLGVDLTEIPTPFTRIVGLRSHAYYDPPSGNEKKPKLVGLYPAAVFQTLASDGRTHAHRIYLNETGEAKAELGTMPNGQARDTKKAARRIDGQPSTAGCVVAWGDPTICPHVTLAEGIENACSVAYAFRVEIERGELVVLSGINAGGIEAFTPWPATTQVTVAADRDEGKQGRGFKRGERAARNFAIRTTLGAAGEGADAEQQIRTLVALPGQPGTSVDFLDVLRAEGAEGVRAAILAAQPFQPSADEIAEFENRGQRKSEIEEIARRYPLPSLIGLRVEYRHTEDNRVWLHKYVGFAEDKETDERSEIWEAVSSPFGDLALLQTIDHPSAFGLRVHVCTFSGATNTIDFMRTELPQLGASGVRSALMGAGVRVANGGEMTIVEILKQAEPSPCIDVTQSYGWHRSNGDVFLTPGGKQWRR